VASGPRGRRIPADDELCAFRAFDLKPIKSSARSIRAIATFANDALQLHSASPGHDVRSAAFQVFAVEDGWRSTGRQNLFQDLLAFFKRHCGHIPAVEIENIEDVIDEFPGSARLENILKRLKTGRAVGLNCHNFTVKHDIFDRQPSCGGRELGKLLRPIMSIAADVARLPILQAAQHAIPIEFDLIDPVIPGRRFFGERREFNLLRSGKLRRFHRRMR
jgi:hypothetical protein